MMRSGTSTIDYHARLNAQKIKWIKFKHNNQLSNLPYCHMVFIHPINIHISATTITTHQENTTPLTLTIPQQMYVNYQWINMTWKHTTSPTLICGDKQHTCMHNSQPYIYILFVIFCGIWYYRDSTRYNSWNIHEHNNILHKYIQ